MQSKVSIVMPCYNKVDYIGAMLKSIIVQKWDNVEVILVNDGSTDGTREVIAEYESMFRERGYEITVVDQENAGCCAAVYAGLTRITGDYMCLIDADDELDPEYVSTMAGFLEENSDYDYCSCDHLFVGKDNNENITKGYQHNPWPDRQFTAEFFFCNDTNKAAWALLSRMSYIRKCKLIENFYIETRGSYEPSFFVSFCVYNGKMKHFNVPLYYYNSYAEGLSKARTFEYLNKYWTEYHRVVKIMLERCDGLILDRFRRRYYLNLSAFFRLKFLLLSAGLAGGKKQEESLRQDFIRYVKYWLGVEVSYEDICEKTSLVCRAAELALSGIWKKFEAENYHRIIAYGVLGRAAKRLLPQLTGTSLEPTELWDANGDGVKVKRPDFDSLTESDLIICFPSALSIEKEISDILTRYNIKVIFNREINDYLAQASFPQFKEAVMW